MNLSKSLLRLADYYGQQHPDAIMLRQAAAELDRSERAIESLKMQARCWAGEAKCQTATVHDCYRAVGATGKGSWNGARPVREFAQGGVA